LRRIDDPEIGLNAKPVEIADVGLHNPVEGLLEAQKFDGEGLAIGGVANAIANVAARLAQQGIGAAQQAAILPRPV
jgi:hypothetical protein